MIRLSADRLRLASAADETLWSNLSYARNAARGKEFELLASASDRLPRFSRTEPECGAIGRIFAKLKLNSSIYGRKCDGRVRSSSFNTRTVWPSLPALTLRQADAARPPPRFRRISRSMIQSTPIRVRVEGDAGSGMEQPDCARRGLDRARASSGQPRPILVPFPVIFRDDTWWNACTGEELDTFIVAWRPATANLPSTSNNPDPNLA